MNRRALVVFVILNIAISIGVAMLVISLWTASQPPQQSLIVQTFEVIITATPGPTQTPWVVTVQSGAPINAPARSPQPGEPTVAPTLNPEILPDIATSAALTQIAIQASGSEEQTYTVQAGDNPSLIAEAFEVPLADLLCANDLGTVDDPEFIYEGQVLIIPGADFVCEAGAAVAEVEPEAATGEETTDTGEEATLAGAVDTALSNETPIPTVTLAPTAEDARVIIVQVVGAGDVTSEGVELRNQGGLVDLQGWTLYDTEGHIYTFPEARLFADGSVTVFTRVGEDTAIALFWNQTEPVWQEGDVVSLADADGVVQSTFRVGVDEPRAGTSQ